MGRWYGQRWRRALDRPRRPGELRPSDLWARFEARDQLEEEWALIWNALTEDAQRDAVRERAAEILRAREERINV